MKSFTVVKRDAGDYELSCAIAALGDDGKPDHVSMIANDLPDVLTKAGQYCDKHNLGDFQFNTEHLSSDDAKSLSTLESNYWESMHDQHMEDTCAADGINSFEEFADFALSWAEKTKQPIWSDDHVW